MAGVEKAVSAFCDEAAESTSTCPIAAPAATAELQETADGAESEMDVEESDSNDDPGVTEHPSEVEVMAARSWIASEMAREEEEMRQMWEFPEMMSFLLTAKSWLKMVDFSVYECERMLIFPQCSSMLNGVMTALLCTETERKSIDIAPPMPYPVWMSKLKAKTTKWYSWFEMRATGLDTVFDINPEFWNIVGCVNPLDTQMLHEIPFVKRVWLLKAVCDSMLSSHPVLREMFTSLTAEDLRDMRELGKDGNGNQFFHLRTLAEDDLRVYRISPTISAPKPTVSLSKGKVAQRKRRGRPKKIHIAVEDIEDTDPFILTTGGEFYMIVDSLQSLLDLIASYESNSKMASDVKFRPACEVQLEAKLHELLADFSDFSEQLAIRLANSQVEIHLRWQRFHSRPENFEDPDLLHWKQTSKPSRSTTPLPHFSPPGSVEATPTTDEAPPMDSEATPSVNSLTFTPFTPELTRSGRRITSRITSLLEDGDLSEDSEDASDVWILPGTKKKKVKPPKIVDEGSTSCLAVTTPRKYRKKKAAKRVAEAYLVTVDLTAVGKDSVEAAKDPKEAVNDPKEAVEDPKEVVEDPTEAAKNPTLAAVLDTADTAAAAIKVENGAAAITKEPTIVSIYSLLQTSPSVPGRTPVNGSPAFPASPAAKPRTPAAARTPTTAGTPRAARTPTTAGASPKIPNGLTLTLSGKRTPAKRRLTPVAEGVRTPAVHSLGNSSVSITLTPVTPKISSQVTVTMVRKRAEVIELDSDEDTVLPPTIKLPSSCSIVKVKTPTSGGSAGGRTPTALVRFGTPTSGRSLVSRMAAASGISPAGNSRVLDSIVISDDEESAPPKPVYRVVVTETGQNYAQVMSNGSLRVLTHAEITDIRARNNGRLL